jgi:hypothetical protein
VLPLLKAMAIAIASLIAKGALLPKLKLPSLAI